MNELSEKLIKEGYTKDNHPDYVRWDSNWHEFVYTNEYANQMILESPCGLLKKGRGCNGYMSFMGIDWRIENDNSVHFCPLKKFGCEFNHEYMREGFCFGVQCPFKLTDKEYDYKKSYEKIVDDYEAFQLTKKEKFYSRLKWNKYETYCECINWNKNKEDWIAKYDPSICVDRCFVKGKCVLTGKELGGKKGNVYYDVKIKTKRKDDTFWHGEDVISIIKGKKAFDRPKSLVMCEAYVKSCNKNLFYREHNSYSKELCSDKDMMIEVVNIRAEYRATRDLMQDLQDAREGIKVSHESDLIKAKQQEKRERREKNNSPEQRYKKIVKKWGFDKLEKAIELVQEGYEYNEVACITEMADTYYIEKILKIEGIESMVEAEIKKRNKKKPEQLSLL